MKARPMYIVSVVTFTAAVATALYSKSVSVVTAALLAIAAVILGYITCTGRWRRYPAAPPASASGVFKLNPSFHRKTPR